ncbi:hypothetical protein ABE494_17730, partial [Stenotrophomonas lactitubi]|uniref:hypothetical protein n=1 Tax=Stenotrophomonas lactitubi TaxID=2045214 RepID=UPI00320A22A3
LTASALNSSVYCLLAIDTSLASIDYGSEMSTKSWPVHTLLQYERYTGINFRLRAIHKKSLTVQEPVSLSEIIDENEWERSLVYFRSMRVQISCTTRCPSFLASVLVSSYSSDGARQSTRELSRPELKALSREGEVQYVDTLRAPLDQLPVRYAVHVRSGDAPTDHQLSIFVEEVLF